MVKTSSLVCCNVLDNAFIIIRQIRNAIMLITDLACTKRLRMTAEIYDTCIGYIGN